MAATESFSPSTTHKLVANESAFQKTRPTTGAISLVVQTCWEELAELVNMFIFPFDDI